MKRKASKDPSTTTPKKAKPQPLAQKPQITAEEKLAGQRQWKGGIGHFFLAIAERRKGWKVLLYYLDILANKPQSKAVLRTFVRNVVRGLLRPWEL